MRLQNKERQKCEVWSRVMGYFRPISNYNPGKLQEHKDRKFFTRRNKNGKKEKERS